MAKQLGFRQLFEEETSTYTYLIFDQETKEAALIDPVLEKVPRDLNLLKELGLKLKYVLDTHVHADHITGSGKLREATGCQIVLGAGSQLNLADKLVADGEYLALGGHNIKAIATPGHTNGCTTYQVGDLLFTGDTLMIRACGRTDFQQGNPGTMYEVITQKLFTLPDTTKIYPGHDYKGMTMSTVGEEKALNPRIAGKTKEQFVEIMNNLNLAYPKKIDVSLPANLKLGLVA